MIELTTPNGKKVAVNPAHIVAISAYDKGCRLMMVSSLAPSEVKESYEAVLGLLTARVAALPGDGEGN